MKNGSLVAGLIAFLVLAGCEQTNTYIAPPPPKVTVAQPLMQEVIDSLEFTGTTVASAQVEVRARVSGVLQSLHFEPGSPVDQGDLLFVIDPQEYEAELQAAEAELAAAQAQLERAEIEYTRAEKLFKKKAGSEMDVVKWRGERAVADATIQSARAKVDRARLNLGYTQVTAPISGRVGRNRVDVGNLVGEGEATVLTDITEYDPMYVYFNLNELDLLRVMTMYRERVKEMGLDPKTRPTTEADIRVFLGLADEDGYPHEGVLDFGESGVDPDTGTVQLRGVFDNSQKPVVLLPGLFARVRLPVAKRQNIPLVSERAIGTDQSGQYLLTVNSENMVEKRNVRLGQLVDGLRVIEDGLTANNWVVVNGMQRARPGAKVDPEKTDMAELKVSVMRRAEKATEDKPQSATADSPESDQKAR